MLSVFFSFASFRGSDCISLYPLVMLGKERSGIFADLRLDVCTGLSQIPRLRSEVVCAMHDVIQRKPSECPLCALVTGRGPSHPLTMKVILALRDGGKQRSTREKET